MILASLIDIVVRHLTFLLEPALYCTVESESALFRPLATLYCVLSGYANRQLEVSPNGVCDDVASSLAYGELLLGHTTIISRE